MTKLLIDIQIWISSDCWCLLLGSVELHWIFKQKLDVMFEFGRQLRKHECFRKVELGFGTKLLEVNS